MPRSLVRYLPIALGGVLLGTAIAACGGPEGNANSTAPADKPAAVIEAPPTSEANPPAEAIPPNAEETSTPPPDPGRVQPSLEIGQITIDTLMALGGGGCGMTLYAADQSQFPASQGFVLSHGLEENSMRMEINGSILQFRRVDYSGEPFYGQYLSQTFQNDDQGIQVIVDVVLGAPGEIESVEIDSGTLGIEMDGIQRELSVVGDAGC